MLKKLGIVGVGVAATLVAAAPLASATEGGHHDKGHDKGSHQSHDGDHGSASKSCDFTGGTAGAGSDISGNSLANVVAQVPVAGNNIANLANCSSFLNNNLNDNVSGNTVDIL